MEGLPLSCLPCTKVLSVAGFLVKTAQKAGREEFILRGEREVHSAQRPLSRNILTKSVKPSHTRCGSEVLSRSGVPREAWWLSYQGILGGIYPGCGRVHHTQGSTMRLIVSHSLP